MTDDEIVAQMSREADLLGSESEEEPDLAPTVSHDRANEAFGIAVQYGLKPKELIQLICCWLRTG